MAEKRPAEPAAAEEDPIIAGVRAARAALFAAAGNDMTEYVRRLRAEQARSGHPVVSLPPKPVEGSAA